MTMLPAIKWSGSKRSQANAILSYFPEEIETYYEPFCGGASVFRALLDSGINVHKFVLSDINNDLIQLWMEIKQNPVNICAYYEQLWKELNKDDDLERKKAYFAEVRERFNKERNPADFMFIMRTTTNGMPRYNHNGDFNNSFHITRNGINPESLMDIVTEWSRLLNSNDVEFRNCSYIEISPEEKDFVYLDPPYFNTKGMYYGAIDFEELWDYLRKIQCSYAISFDGKSGEVDNTYSVPKDIYDLHTYLKSGNSSFKRTIGKDKNAMVYESLYIRQ